MNRMPGDVCTWPFILLIGLLSGTMARAGEAEDKAEAKRHFVEAEAHYDAGRWAEAITRYQAAYALKPFPSLLFNIGQAYRKQGDAPRAIEYYRRFLAAADPKAKRAGEAREHLAALEATLPQPAPPVESEPPSPPPVETKPAPPPPVVTRPAPPRPTIETPPAPAPKAPVVSTPAPMKPGTPLAVKAPPIPPAKTPEPKRAPWWPWVLGGGVVAAGAIIGIGVGTRPQDGPFDPTVPTVPLVF